MVLKFEFNLLGDGDGIVHFYAKVSNRAFELGMAQKQLHSAKVAGLFINLRGLGARVGAVADWVYKALPSEITGKVAVERSWPRFLSQACISLISRSWASMISFMCEMQSPPQKEP